MPTSKSAKDPLAKSLNLIQRGVSEIIGLDEIRKRLGAGGKLRVKAGFDPTSPDIHLGHAVLINKARHFQELGHQVVFLIGDFTARIGDPSGQDKTRPQLDEKTIAANAERFADQAFKILDRDATEIRRNSEWFGDMPAIDMIRLSAQSTVARMLERDDFSRRFAGGRSISIHEFLYPLLQGYDSIMLKADIELGGTDQKFNLLVGRELQKAAGQQPQAVLTMPILEGLDGVRKMSKSLGNYIGIDESAEQIYGKTMSVSDVLMWRYFELLSERSEAEIAELRANVDAGDNPMAAKKILACELAGRFAGGDQAAHQAGQDFERRFSKGMLPESIEEFTIDSGGEQDILLAYALKSAGMAKSTSEARRKIAQGGIRIDGIKVLDENRRLAKGERYIAQAGRRRHVCIAVV